MRTILSAAVLLASLAGLSAWGIGGGDAVLEGPLMYPGCAAPADLHVCAEELSTGRQVCVAPAATPDGPIYRMVVPAGTYRVFAETGARPGYRAYFSAAVRCGLDAACSDHAPELIEASAGHSYSGVSPADWFAPEVAEVPALLARR